MAQPDDVMLPRKPRDKRTAKKSTCTCNQAVHCK